jgi:hypothetical protein
MTGIAATERTRLVAFLQECGWSCQDGIWQHPKASGQFNLQGALLRLGRQLGTATEVPILHDDTGYCVGLMSDAGEVSLVEHFDDIDESVSVRESASAPRARSN